MKPATQLLVRIDPKLHRALHRIRRKTNKSLSDQAREALTKWVAEQTAPPAPQEGGQ